LLQAWYNSFVSELVVFFGWTGSVGSGFYNSLYKTQCDCSDNEFTESTHDFAPSILYCDIGMKRFTMLLDWVFSSGRNHCTSQANNGADDTDRAAETIDLFIGLGNRSFVVVVRTLGQVNVQAGHNEICDWKGHGCCSC